MSSMKRVTWLVGVLAVVAAAAAIGIWVLGPGPTPTASDDAGSTTSDLNVAPEVGARAPSFTLPTLDGEEVSLADYEGQPVILDFWASWCPNCNQTAPHLTRFHQETEDVAVIGINMGVRESEAEIRGHVSEHGIDYPIALDDGSVTETFRVTATSTYIFIDANGVIREIKSGTALDFADFETAYRNTVNPEG